MDQVRASADVQQPHDVHNVTRSPLRSGGVSVSTGEAALSEVQRGEVVLPAPEGGAAAEPGSESKKRGGGQGYTTENEGGRPIIADVSDPVPMGACLAREQACKMGSSNSDRSEGENRSGTAREENAAMAAIPSGDGKHPETETEVQTRVPSAHNPVLEKGGNNRVESVYQRRRKYDNTKRCGGDDVAANSGRCGASGGGVGSNERGSGGVEERMQQECRGCNTGNETQAVNSERTDINTGRPCSVNASDVIRFSSEICKGVPKAGLQIPFGNEHIECDGVRVTEVRVRVASSDAKASQVMEAKSGARAENLGLPAHCGGKAMDAGNKEEDTAVRTQRSCSRALEDEEFQVFQGRVEQKGDSHAGAENGAAPSGRAQTNDAHRDSQEGWTKYGMEKRRREENRPGRSQQDRAQVDYQANIHVKQDTAVHSAIMAVDQSQHVLGRRPGHPEKLREAIQLDSQQQEGKGGLEPSVLSSRGKGSQRAHSQLAKPALISQFEKTKSTGGGMPRKAAAADCTWTLNPQNASTAPENTRKALQSLRGSQYGLDQGDDDSQMTVPFTEHFLTESTASGGHRTVRKEAIPVSVKVEEEEEDMRRRLGASARKSAVSTPFAADQPSCIETLQRDLQRTSSHSDGRGGKPVDGSSGKMSNLGADEEEKTRILLKTPKSENEEQGCAFRMTTPLPKGAADGSGGHLSKDEFPLVDGASFQRNQLPNRELMKDVKGNGAERFQHFVTESTGEPSPKACGGPVTDPLAVMKSMTSDDKLGRAGERVPSSEERRAAAFGFTIGSSNGAVGMGEPEKNDCKELVAGQCPGQALTGRRETVPKFEAEQAEGSIPAGNARVDRHGSGDRKEAEGELLYHVVHYQQAAALPSNTVTVLGKTPRSEVNVSGTAAGEVQLLDQIHQKLTKVEGKYGCVARSGCTSVLTMKRLARAVHLPRVQIPQKQQSIAPSGPQARRYRWPGCSFVLSMKRLARTLRRVHLPLPQVEKNTHNVTTVSGPQALRYRAEDNVCVGKVVAEDKENVEDVGISCGSSKGKKTLDQSVGAHAVSDPTPLQTRAVNQSDSEGVQVDSATTTPQEKKTVNQSVRAQQAGGAHASDPWGKENNATEMALRRLDDDIAQINLLERGVGAETARKRENRKEDFDERFLTKEPPFSKLRTRAEQDEADLSFLRVGCCQGCSLESGGRRRRRRKRRRSGTERKVVAVKAKCVTEAVEAAGLLFNTRTCVQSTLPARSSESARKRRCTLETAMAGTLLNQTATQAGGPVCSSDSARKRSCTGEKVVVKMELMTEIVQVGRGKLVKETILRSTVRQECKEEQSDRGEKRKRRSLGCDKCFPKGEIQCQDRKVGAEIRFQASAGEEVRSGKLRSGAKCESTSDAKLVKVKHETTSQATEAPFPGPVSYPIPVPGPVPVLGNIPGPDGTVHRPWWTMRTGIQQHRGASARMECGGGGDVCTVRLQCPSDDCRNCTAPPMFACGSQVLSPPPSHGKRHQEAGYGGRRDVNGGGENGGGGNSTGMQPSKRQALGAGGGGDGGEEGDRLIHSLKGEDVREDASGGMRSNVREEIEGFGGSLGPLLLVGMTGSGTGLAGSAHGDARVEVGKEEAVCGRDPLTSAGVRNEHGSNRWFASEKSVDISRGLEAVPIRFAQERHGAGSSCNGNPFGTFMYMRECGSPQELVLGSRKSSCCKCSGNCLGEEGEACCCAAGMSARYERFSDCTACGWRLSCWFLQQLEETRLKRLFCYSGLCPAETGSYVSMAGSSRSAYCTGHPVRPTIQECCQWCPCGLDCGNRVVQRGLTCNLEVFRRDEEDRWRLRTLTFIPKGMFVCEFAGEVITCAENVDRAKKYKSAGVEHRYMSLDAGWLEHRSDMHNDNCFAIDATQYGNVGRFVNHRCGDANLIDVPVQIKSTDWRIYHVAFFTCKAVEAMEELTLVRNSVPQRLNFVPQTMTWWRTSETNLLPLRVGGVGVSVVCVQARKTSGEKTPSLQSDNGEDAIASRRGRRRHRGRRRGRRRHRGSRRHEYCVQPGKEDVGGEDAIAAHLGGMDGGDIDVGGKLSTVERTAVGSCYRGPLSLSDGEAAGRMRGQIRARRKKVTQCTTVEGLDSGAICNVVIHAFCAFGCGALPRAMPRWWMKRRTGGAWEDLQQCDDATEDFFWDKLHMSPRVFREMRKLRRRYYSGV
ncbi:hypothetical protein CBR_g28480 [Chara braunii]|uniref:SET domain-containing protein n=1 Tax=Chara braunii TaxID=69332 RepID=A0A388JW06_CHABU|nr:hypothetical protein CBR_g28480 [Chara braunii]|eukprot:GBG62004.1 hypothetical protein CBR_g28480 [Chara braunii]